MVVDSPGAAWETGSTTMNAPDSAALQTSLRRKSLNRSPSAKSGGDRDGAGIETWTCDLRRCDAHLPFLGLLLIERGYGHPPPFLASGL